MSRKHDRKDPSGLTFDTRTKAVVTSLPQLNQKMIKDKVLAVKEVVQNKKPHEITLVLQHYDYNVGDTIAAFLDDGAESILKEWNYNGTKPVKSKKKKPKKNDNEVDTNDKEAPVISAKLTAKQSQEIDDSQDKVDKVLNGTREVLNSNITSAKSQKANAGLTKRASKESRPSPEKETTPTSAKCDAKEIQKNKISRNSSISEAGESTGSSQSKGKKAIEKPVKELNRHALSFQKTGVLLSDEMDKSMKRLRQSFIELRQLLDGREAEVVKLLEMARIESKVLLNMREQQACQLKMLTDRADTMTDSELDDLRLDIKQFTADRKLDEELGRTVRFIRDHDKLVKEIKSYGEVTPVKNDYIKRQFKLVNSSIINKELQPDLPTETSRVTVAAVNGEPIRRIDSGRQNADRRQFSRPLERTSVNDQFQLPTADSDQRQFSRPLERTSVDTVKSALSTSELADLQQRLQDSLRLQGLPIKAGQLRQNTQDRISDHRQGPESKRLLTNNSDGNVSQIKVNARSSGGSFDGKRKSGELYHRRGYQSNFTRESDRGDKK